MSLVTDAQEWLAEDSDVHSLTAMDDVEYIASEFVESRRWYDIFTYYYKRGEEYIGVDVQEPSTELQEDGDFDPPKVYEVRPVVVEVTQYERV